MIHAVLPQSVISGAQTQEIGTLLYAKQTFYYVKTCMVYSFQTKKELSFLFI